MGQKKVSVTDGHTIITHSRACQEKSELLADVLAVQADEIIEKYDKDIALLSMEGLTQLSQQRSKAHETCRQNKSLHLYSI